MLIECLSVYSYNTFEHKFFSTSESRKLRDFGGKLKKNINFSQYCRCRRPQSQLTQQSLSKKRAQVKQHCYRNKLHIFWG